MIKIHSKGSVPKEFESPENFIHACLSDLFFLCTIVLRHGKRLEFRDFNWIHRDLCDFLDITKNPIPQKLILMSRDSFKSTIARAFVIQWFLRKAYKREDGKIFIYGGKIELPTDHLTRLIWEVLNNDLIQAYFSRYIPNKRGDFDQIALDKGRVRYKGIEIDIGAPDSPLTGHHYEGGINDNLVNEVNVRTPQMRAKIVDLWRAQESILIKDAWEFVFETTWEKDDVSGTILGRKFNYKKLYRKPAYQFVSNTGYAVFSCPARDQKGEVAIPGKMDEKYLRRKRSKQGAYLYNRLYELQPSSSDEIIFKPEWVKKYDTLPRDFIRTITIDCAGTKTKSSAYSAITMADTDPDGVQYIHYAEKKKVSILELLEWAARLVNESAAEGKPVSHIGIEREKFGIALAELMEERFPDMLVWEIKIQGRPRHWRIGKLAPLMEGGKILLKQGLFALEDEISNYKITPDGRAPDTNVDLLDSLFYQTEVKIVPKETPEDEEEEEDDGFSAQLKKEKVGGNQTVRGYVQGRF